MGTKAESGGIEVKAERLKEFKGYGYTTIGETENDETVVAKTFESGTVLIMAVHEKYVSQIRLTKDQFELLKNFGTTE